MATSASESELLQENERLRQRLEVMEQLEAEHSRVAMALKERESRYRHLIESLPLGLIVVDTSGRIQEVNQALLNILGSPSADATRAINVLTFPPLVNAGVSADFSACLTSGRALESEHPYLTRWGKHTYLRYHISPLCDAAGRTNGGQAIVEDFTSRKQISDQLTKALDALSHKAIQLIQANEELQQFSSAVSHDIKAPLRSIRFYADLLEEEVGATLPQEAKSSLEQISRYVRQAEELVEDLLRLARMDVRRATPQPVALRPFLHDLVRSLPLPDSVVVDIAADLPEISSEPGLLRQVYQNLILNAVRFNRSETIRIHLGWHEVDENALELSVQDNGIGIDPRYHERIFHVFERLHTQEEYEGTGIGLSLVKKAALKLGGKVRVDSRLGEGATFFVRLPWHLQAEDTAPSE